MREIDENNMILLAHSAATQAALSLQKFTDQQLFIDVGNVEKIFNQLLPSQNNDFYSITLEIRGDVSGCASLIFHKDVAIKLASCLTKRDINFHDVLDPLSLSALKETGNIMLGSFLTVLSTRLHIKFIEHIPLLQVRSGLPYCINNRCMDYQIDHFSIRVIFNFLGLDIQDGLLLIFDLESEGKIIDALQKLREIDP